MALTVAEGVSWADGVPVDARDICFSVDALLEPANPVTWAAEHRRVLAGCGVSPDHRVATVRFARPVHNPRDWLDIPVLPAHVFSSPVIPTDHPFATRAFGSLGVRAVRHEDGVTFDHPGGPPPHIGHLELRTDLGLEDLLAGRAHGMVHVPVGDWDRVRRQEEALGLKSYDRRDVWFIALNHRGMLAGREGRVALDEALDKAALIAAVWGDWGGYGPDILTGPYRQASPYYNRAVNPREHDAAAPLAGRLKLGVGEAQAALAPGLAAAVAAQLRARGLEVDVVQLPGDPFAPGQDPGVFSDLDLLIVRWVARRPDHVRPIFAGDGTHNPFRVRDPEVDRLLAAMEGATTDQDYTRAAHDLHQHVFDSVHAVWLTSGITRSAWALDIRSNVISPLHYWTAFGAWKRQR